MEEYTHWEGCYSKGSEVQGWQWGKIRIWQDHWLPKKHPPLLSECPITDFEDFTVDILIDSQTRQWNVEMVEG